MREQLYSKIVSALKWVTEFFESKLGSYRVAQARKHADAFLKEFRSRPGYDTTWALGKPETWPRKTTDPKCDHRKGHFTGNRNPKPLHTDFSVGAHTFPDGTQKIWCLQNCGFESHPGDKNWSEACYMLRNSSNRPSSSEVGSLFLAKEKRMVQAVYAEPAPDDTHIVSKEAAEQIDGVITEDAIQDEFDGKVEDNG